ncbi:MAG: hypothetical protein A2X77_01455 [Gammaproteobacteria bacterium GWE2_42_36]|nr:MAG: hypothetical protein A2X77_01455 [Gammaproteobacteria bacterium GWE2_42_36]HCU05202.1 hypothetical protein [Coxiellaceae bacterium]
MRQPFMKILKNSVQRSVIPPKKSTLKENVNCHSLRDEDFLRGKIAILPLSCKREFTSHAASNQGSNSRAISAGITVQRFIPSILNPQFSILTCLVSALTLLTLTQPAFASRFQLNTQSGASVGNFAAGAAAAANDASTSFYNPAGLTRISRQDGILSLITDVSNSQFKGQTNVSPTISDFTQNTGLTQGGDMRLLPTFLYGAPLDDKWGFGFNLTSPFDVATNYGQNEFTRYTISKVDLRVFDLSPSVAYHVLPYLSLGLGIDANRAEIKFNQVNTTDSIVNDQLNQSEMTNWATGWNAGILWEIDAATRAGLSYRSSIFHQLYGTSNSNGQETRAKERLTLPPTTLFSLYHDFSSQWALMGSAQYTQWSKTNSFLLTNILTPTGTTSLNLQNHLRNAWLFSLGADYHWTSAFITRCGIGFDQSAVASSNRTIIMPDSDRYIAAAGLGYRFTDTLSSDLGYSHIFARRSSINHTMIDGSQAITNVGNLDLSDDMIGLQIDWLMT